MRHERKGEDQKKLEAVENAKSKQETRAPNPLLVSGVPACHSHAHPLPSGHSLRSPPQAKSGGERVKKKKKKTRSSPKGKPASVRNLEPAEADKGRGGQRREREREGRPGGKPGRGRGGPLTNLAIPNPEASIRRSGLGRGERDPADRGALVLHRFELAPCSARAGCVPAEVRAGPVAAACCLVAAAR
jgi:hypothetical protein